MNRHNPKTVAILLTCFNRKDVTLACLENVFRQEHIEQLTIQVFLVDDGCTDGTADAVRARFPDVVIIQGNGSMYWNKGMRLAWQTALPKNFDFYIWLNDDSHIYADALSRMIAAYQQLANNLEKPGALVGTMIDPDNRLPTYGGRSSYSKINPLKLSEVIPPQDTPLACDAINGNFTLISRAAVETIGILSDAYTHGGGDFDYGLRLIHHGMTCWVAPGIYGECSRNPVAGNCRDSKLSLKQRLQKLQMPNQFPPAKERMHFVKQHGGYIWPLLWIKVWVRLRFPWLWVLFRSK